MLFNSQVLCFVSRSHTVLSVPSVVRAGPTGLAPVIQTKAELFLDRAKTFRTDTGVYKRDKTLQGYKLPWRMESTHM